MQQKSRSVCARVYVLGEVHCSSRTRVTLLVHPACRSLCVACYVRSYLWCVSAISVLDLVRQVSSRVRTACCMSLSVSRPREVCQCVKSVVAIADRISGHRASCLACFVLRLCVSGSDSETRIRCTVGRVRRVTRVPRGLFVSPLRYSDASVSDPTGPPRERTTEYRTRLVYREAYGSESRVGVRHSVVSRYTRHYTLYVP